MLIARRVDQDIKLIYRNEDAADTILSFTYPGVEQNVLNLLGPQCCQNEICVRTNTAGTLLDTILLLDSPSLVVRYIPHIPICNMLYNLTRNGLSLNSSVLRQFHAPDFANNLRINIENINPYWTVKSIQIGANPNLTRHNYRIGSYIMTQKEYNLPLEPCKQCNYITSNFLMCTRCGYYDNSKSVMYTLNDERKIVITKSPYTRQTIMGKHRHIQDKIIIDIEAARISFIRYLQQVYQSTSVLT